MQDTEYLAEDWHCQRCGAAFQFTDRNPMPCSKCGAYHKLWVTRMPFKGTEWKTAGFSSFGAYQCSELYALPESKITGVEDLWNKNQRK